MTQLYRIHVRSTITGCTWHGTGKFPAAQAQMLADGNKERADKDGHYYLVYWIEPAPDDDDEQELGQ